MKTISLSPPHRRRSTAALVLALLLAGCSTVGPSYQVPSMDVPGGFKEAAQGPWVNATPSDALDRGTWWELFGDAQLDALAKQVEVSNQNVAAAVASYAQARALVAQQRAALSPELNLNTSANFSGGGGNTPTQRSYRLGIGASWEPDVWGRLRNAVDATGAAAQASAADLASARLAAQGELVLNYLSLRALDAQRALMAQTLTGYQRAAQITRNRYDAGIAPRSDLLQAQTQLANAQADDLGVQRQRAQAEHAIAVIIGKAPAQFSLPPEPQWRPRVPVIPLVLPSTLLQRRPDIAARERRVAQANAQIGVAQAAQYPSIGLSGSLGTGGPRITDLFSVPNLVWAVGASLAQTLFDAGARSAQVDAARASHEAAAAQYRQAVLSAFQDVEDVLVATTVLEQQQRLREQASQAADLVEQQMLNRYQAGQVGYTEVISTQTAAQNARRAMVQVQADRQSAAVSLIQAIGGGWMGSGATP